ncbi:MAG: hypothetical protein ACXWQO_20055 [Bdellovibrionota bacterium]
MRKFNQVPQLLRAALVAGTCLLPLTAFADKGGDNSGGGNTINHKLVEKYVHEDPSDIKGYNELQARIAKIRETFPALADSIKEHLGEMDWYVVPKTISQLPASKTGLHFTTEQPIYQTSSEIFISEEALKKMSTEELGDAFTHEGVMSLTGDKHSDLVRPVTVRLLSDKPSADKIQNALAKFNFGAYFTKEQMAELAKRNTMKTFFDNTLYEANKLNACQGTEEDEKLYKTISENDSSWDWIGVTMDLSQQFLHESIGHDPGDVWVACGGLTPMGPSFSDVPVSSSPACREVEKVYGDDDRIRGLNLPNIDARLQALKFAGQQYDAAVDQAIVKLAETLGQSNAYLTLLAISAKNPNVDYKWNMKVLNEQRPERKKVYDKLKPKVDQRRAQIDFSDKASLYRLRCNSYKALTKEYLQLAPAASVEKYGQDNPAKDSDSENKSAE